MKQKMLFHHIGYLVKDIERSAAAFELIGYRRIHGSYDPVQKADILFLETEQIRIELVAPHSDSEIYALLKKYKNSPYHICYQVANMDEATEELADCGFVLFRNPVPAIVISEKARVSFLMNQSTGIIELVEM